MQYEALYYNGYQSTGHKALITLMEWGFVISSAPDATQFAPIHWELSLIKSNDFNTHNRVVMHYGTEQPLQYIETSDPLFYEAIQMSYPQHRFSSNIYKTAMRNSGSMIGIGALFLGICAGIYFFIIPVVASGLAATFPIKWEQELGEKMYENVKVSEDINDLKSAKLQEFFDALNFETEYNIQLSYAESSDVNAFAMPGGHIVVYDGLFDKISNYTELAGLLGHEFSHIQFRHSTKDIFRSLSSYLLISLVFGDASGVVGVIAENADMLKRLSYSRDFEHEADANAYTLMVDQLIETEGLVSLFKQLQIEEQKQGIDIPQFISSHPLTDDRIDFIQQKIKNDNIRFVSNEKLKKIFEELKSMETTPSKEENEVELIEKKVRELVDSLGLE